MNRKQEGDQTSLPKTLYAALSIQSEGYSGAIVGVGSRPIYFEEKRKSASSLGSILKKLLSAERTLNGKLVAVGIAAIRDTRVEAFASRLWQHHDIVPHLVDALETPTKKSVRELADTIASEYSGLIARVTLAPHREVKPSFLTDLQAVAEVVSRSAMKTLLAEAKEFKGQHGKIVFIGSTPAGGGVALMRHALLRLLRLVGIDAHWHVLRPSLRVFDITKRKFHNVFQGVAPKNTFLTTKDKRLYSEWIADNARIFRPVIKHAKVVVIDDPQPSGLIPFIRLENPAAKIIFRSHIELRADLIKKKDSPQYNTWSFLKPNIGSADLFVSHPVEAFFPHDIPRKKIVTMPATTDPLDGLNKKLSPKEIRYYERLFNQFLLDTGQNPLSFTRPYFIQVARFDPSKGIPDVIESYRRFRKRFDDLGRPKRETPQLVLVGNGAIDDPEGVFVLQEVTFLLGMDRYRHIAQDVKVARVPHIDQMLNMLLSKSFLAFQLSHREGFEVKVSEALHMGKPVIAYRTGGIPLQIESGKNGYLVRPGDTKKVAEYLFRLTTNPTLYRRMCKRALRGDYDRFGTVANATRWLYLANELIVGHEIVGNGRTVEELIHRKHS